MNVNAKSMRPLWLVGMMAAALGLSACQSVSAPKANTPAATTESPVIHATELAQEWYLVGAKSVDPKYHNAVPATHMDLTHLPTIHVYSGCNRLRFHWQAADAPQAMTIGMGTSTLMACQNPLGEQLMSTYLPKMSAYAFEGEGMLVLSSSDGSELIFANRASIEQRGMSERFIPKHQ